MVDVRLSFGDFRFTYRASMILGGKNFKEALFAKAVFLFDLVPAPKIFVPLSLFLPA